jgi:hypothetical protein
MAYFEKAIGSPGGCSTLALTDAAPAEDLPRRNAGVGGPTRLIVYCADYKCAHSIVVDASRWGDDVRLSDLEPRFTCQVCGHRGTDIRPLFKHARIGPG